MSTELISIVFTYSFERQCQVVEETDVLDDRGSIGQLIYFVQGKPCVTYQLSPIAYYWSL